MLSLSLSSFIPTPFKNNHNNKLQQQHLQLHTPDHPSSSWPGHPHRRPPPISSTSSSFSSSMDQSPPSLLSDTTTSPYQHQQLADNLLPGRAPPATTPVSSAWLGHSRHPPRSTSPPSPPPHRIRHHHHPFIQRLRPTTLDVLRRRARRHWPCERRPSPHLRAQPRVCEDNSCSSSDHRQQRAPPCRAHRRCSAAVDGHAPPWAAPPRWAITGDPLGPPPHSPARCIGDSCVLHDVPS
ncbi:formin-like protein 5 [Iris pallida]|uniref:Formin-like protein 5 n=1 Tax=Iris pallida TaxID=29817 RepID=A0AAX6FTG7_IRIPA|nr:formin-like protein 5 [Iris pallida]